MLALCVGQAFSAPTAVITGGGADRGDLVIPIEALDQDGLGGGGKRGGGKRGGGKRGGGKLAVTCAGEDQDGQLGMLASNVCGGGGLVQARHHQIGDHHVRTGLCQAFHRLVRPRTWCTTSSLMRGVAAGMGTGDDGGQRRKDRPSAATA
jgi:hypothetical protein